MGRQQILKGLFLSAVFAAFGIGQAMATTVTWVTDKQIPSYTSARGMVTHAKGPANKAPTSGYSCSYGSGVTLYGKIAKFLGDNTNASMSPRFVYFVSNAQRGAFVDTISSESSCSEDVDGDGSLDTAYEYAGSCAGC